ncbi:hypothetical protein ACFYMW_40040 [Streptomyces sp. NPDC006692]|uniref:hypothetical protein n=1 Tax=Streptomyces sp. NPDC006692 TaxID=3364758 RepID=UPI0036955C0C
MRIGSRSPLISVAAVIAMSMVIPGCSQSQPTQSAQPTRKIVKHTFYGVNPASPDQREILSWTSQGDNGPIDGTYTLQEKANDSASWTTSSDPKPFQGTQHGNEISLTGEQLGGDVHGTIQQNGHRLHLDSDLGIATYDLYDSPSATPSPPTSQPPAFTSAKWSSGPGISVTGKTSPDWGNRKYSGGLNKGWFLVYSRAAVSAGRVRANSSDCTMPVQGHSDYCIGADSVTGVDLGGGEPLDEGIYQATEVTLFDEDNRQIDTSAKVPAGQNFRALLQSRMLDPKNRPGDIAAVWLDSTKRFGVSGFKEFPVDAFLPVTS